MCRAPGGATAQWRDGGRWGTLCPPALPGPHTRGRPGVEVASSLSHRGSWKGRAFENAWRAASAALLAATRAMVGRRWVGDPTPPRATAPATPAGALGLLAPLRDGGELGHVSAAYAHSRFISVHSCKLVVSWHPSTVVLCVLLRRPRHWPTASLQVPPGEL